MKRRRVLDFAAYVAVALLIVLLITALALSNVPEGTSKGVINGCISGRAVFVTLLQQFRRARRRFAFWAIVVPAVIAHL
ncbi:MAG TPA: hypothetical protein VGV87_28195, partial [Blastocatellia bacterium]|nr:hypothetical protein [Blastocatellia bacterium]